MASALVKDEIESPIAAVWACFADFGDLSKWVPGSPRVELEGAGDRVGAVRKVHGQGGTPICERLETYDTAAKTFSYAIVDSPFPFTDYVATVKLKEVGPGSTAIEWSSVFAPRGLSAERATEVIEGTYRMFIGRLKESLATA